MPGLAAVGASAGRAGVAGRSAVGTGTVGAPDAGEGSAGPDDVCGVCGARLLVPEAFEAMVRDSSALEDQDPGLDGLRTVRACSPRHLAKMISRYIPLARRGGGPPAPARVSGAFGSPCHVVGPRMGEARGAGLAAVGEACAAQTRGPSPQRTGELVDEQVNASAALGIRAYGGEVSAVLQDIAAAAAGIGDQAPPCFVGARPAWLPPVRSGLRDGHTLDAWVRGSFPSAISRLRTRASGCPVARNCRRRFRAGPVVGSGCDQGAVGVR